MHRLIGREEKALRCVAQPGLIASDADRGFRRDNRNDRPRDEVPILIELERNHRLNVERVPHRIRRTNTKIPVALQRHADEVGDRIVELLGQLALTLLGEDRRAGF